MQSLFSLDRAIERLGCVDRADGQQGFGRELRRSSKRIGWGLRGGDRLGRGSDLGGGDQLDGRSGLDGHKGRRRGRNRLRFRGEGRLRRGGHRLPDSPVPRCSRERLHRCRRRRDSRLLHPRRSRRFAQARQPALDRLDRGPNARSIGLNATVCGQLRDPAPEFRLAGRDHRQHGRRDGAILLEQPVVHLLEFVRDFAELGESHHPAAALERVELPARDAQGLAVAGVQREAAVLLAHGLEHLARLGDEHLEDLVIDRAVVGGEDALRLVRHGRGCDLVGADHLGEHRAGRTGFDLAQRCSRLACELVVADEPGVVAELGETCLERRARGAPRLGRLPGGDELGQLRLRVRDGGLDRGFAGLGGAGRLAPTLREQGCDQALVIRTLLLDGFDVEAETRQGLGEQLEILVVHRRGGIGIRVDLLLTQGQQLRRRIEAQHTQRPADLVAVASERLQLAALAVIAEEGVEHLLHVPQVGLDLAPDLGEQQPLLCTARHLVDYRRRRRAFDHARVAGRIEAGEHRVHVGRELRGKCSGILERVLGEQQRRRELHRDGLGHVRVRHVVDSRREAADEMNERRVSDLGGVAVHGRERLAQLRQVLGATGRELQPCVLRVGELLARIAHVRLDAHEVLVQHLGRRNQAREPERVLHVRDARRDRRTDRDVIQHFPPQTVRHLGRAFHEPADLQIDARRELLHAEARVEPALEQRVVQSACRPPEGAQAARLGGLFDRGDGIAHLPRAVLLAAQPLQQPALVLPALAHEIRMRLRYG